MAFLDNSGLTHFWGKIKEYAAGLVATHNANISAHVILFATKANKALSATTLPTSGTALSDNTVYTIANAVGTYTLTPPAAGWAHGTFSTASTFAITFATNAKYLGEAPSFEASTQYEFDVLDGVWWVQEVTA